MDEYLKQEINDMTLELGFRSANMLICFEDKKELKKLIGRVNAKLEREKQEPVYVAIMAILITVFVAAIPKCINSIMEAISVFNNDFNSLQISSPLELIFYAGTLLWLLYVIKKPLKTVFNRIERLAFLCELLKIYIDDNLTNNDY
ncbi:hypothetical protein AB0Y38_05260 [Lysinibacillus capsici]|uniref:hypothetical protein n=1 Tax=Lysinibacillus capsici TaxID=2115968 RepID=UPI003F241ABD